MNFNDIKSFHYSSLTLYETSEIDNYIEFIYFIGCPKIKKNNFFTYCNNNYGYDDNRGNYIITIGDHIAYRYELCDIFGKESFGQVIKCFDHKIRSLEVILGLSCGISIDIWILDEFEQLACIMEVLDLLEKSLIEKSPRKKIFFDSAGNPRFTVFSKGKQRFPFSKTLSQIIKCDDISLIFYLSVYYEIQNIV
ncbi:hypothetical protein PCANB_000115 [Pneumocystis canis]|nr:hypothetical protein PCANB_000115 [Pneumocystis canis]